MSYDFFSPTAVCNEALMAAGVDVVLGDIMEGTQAANACLRVYGTCRQQLLRTAGWNFARKAAQLVLVADATGQTANVGSTTPGDQWIYAYALPTDWAFIRYVPWNPFVTPATPIGNIVPPDPSAPLTTGTGQQSNIPPRIVPARFIVTTDINNIEEGASNVGVGSSPIGRTVICTNVKQANCIYTFDATYPNLWSSQFREALVAYMASLIGLPLNKDKKFGAMLRAQNIAIAKDKIKQARVSEGKESWSNSDLAVDWMRFRNAGGYGGLYSWMANVGDWSCNYDNIGWGGGTGTGNSSAY